MPKRRKQRKTPTLPATKKPKLAPIRIETSGNDPLIAHLREYSRITKLEQTANVESLLLDQIALEGLAGITLCRLYRILDAILPKFNFIQDSDCQGYVWSVICGKYFKYPADIGVRAFYLDSRKKSDEQTSTTTGSQNSPNKGVVIDKKIRLPHQTVSRIAKIDSLLHPVQDGIIMGSCANYLDRLDISQRLMDSFDPANPMDSIQFVQAEYNLGNVFLVAGQSSRSKAILPNWMDPNADVKLREYCALELIGKSRTLGTVFPNDKALGRYRIILTAKGLITQYQQTNSSPIEHHLKRFARRSDLSSSSIGARQTDGSPDADGSEGNGKDDTGADMDEDEDEDAQGRNVAAGKGALTTNELGGFTNGAQALWKVCCNPAKLKADRSTLTMVYDIIANSADGLTQVQLRRRLSLPKFHLRNHLKNLISLNMIHSQASKDPENPFRIYKTAHRSTRRRVKRPKESLERPAGVMASWDEADLRAKRIIGHKRSSFSQAEDSLLILCRITSLLIDSELRLSWCVHKRWVRDLLHKELVESHDKTSDACLRRIKYLKRLPNNIMSINELTAELRDDPDITRLIGQSRPARGSDGGGKPTTATKDSSSLLAEQAKVSPATAVLENDEKMNKLFGQILRKVRAKIPNLLGISSSAGLVSGPATGAPAGPPGRRKLISSRGSVDTAKAATISATSPDGRTLRGRAVGGKQATITCTPSAPTTVEPSSAAPLACELAACPPPSVASSSPSAEIGNHSELMSKYELVDCQSVAAIKRPPTYEEAKNLVDVKLNQACLVTMAFTLSTCVEHSAGSQGQPASGEPVGAPLGRRLGQQLLDRFYSNYPDKLISSIVSKLNKRSLLTRKCPAEQANLYRPKTKTSLKLNQSVLFLLNRYQSSSLMQLGQPIKQLYRIDLSESNEMASIALLTSLCSLHSFADLTLDLRIPTNVVGIDQGNENFRSLCERANERTRDILERFMRRLANGRADASAPTVAIAPDTPRRSARAREHARQRQEELAGAAEPQRAGELSGGATFAELAPLAPLQEFALDWPAERGERPEVEDKEDKEEPDEAEEGPAGPDARSGAAEGLNVNPTCGPILSRPARSPPLAANASKMDDSRRALFLLRHELKTQALDKCGSLADCLVVQPCRVKFSSREELASQLEPLERYLARATVADQTDSSVSASASLSLSSSSGSSLAAAAPTKAADSGPQSPGKRAPEHWRTNRNAQWLVRSYRMDTSERPIEAPDWMPKLVPVQFEARLWKRIDGHVHLATLLKLVESLLSWIVVFPGVERSLLAREFGHLMPDEHLLELLALMEELQLVESHRVQLHRPKPRLFGYQEAPAAKPSCQVDSVLTYEAPARAFLQYCQLLDYCNSK